MNFDMYSNKQYNDDLDASYIYPRPYIDPMMYVNSSGMQMNPNTMGGYMTYMKLDKNGVITLYMSRIQ